MKAPVVARSKVLVTGGSGLIGSAVLRRLGGEYEVHAPPSAIVDWTKPPHGYISILQPTAVVHCAATLGGVAWQKVHPANSITESLVAAAQVFDQTARLAASGHPVHLVFFSSSTVYPSSVARWVENEDRVSDPDFLGDPHRASENWPLSPEPQYEGVGGMKIYLENLLHYYTKTVPGFSATVLRPTAVYGPNDKGFLRAGHVIPDLLRRADAGELPLKVWGNLNVVRDFVYSEDVAEAVFQALARRQIGSEVFNIGSGTKTTIGGLAQAVLETVYSPERLAELEDRHSGGLIQWADGPSAMKWRQVSITMAQTYLHWTPRTGLAEGLRKTLDWWRAQQAEKGTA